MNTKIPLPSGAVLEIQTAPFETVMDAIQIIARELMKVDLKIGSDLLKRVQEGGDVGVEDLDVSVLKDAILLLVGSKEFRPMLSDLFRSTTYAGIKVDSTTWEAEKARGDYFLAAWEVIKKNVGPFFGPLLSSLSARAKANIDARKSG